MGSLTQVQRSLIIGTILGDGYLRIMPGRKDAFLEINHSYKARSYVDWKFQILKDICCSGPKSRRGNGERLAYRFFTKQHPELTELFLKFYKDGNKIVPDMLRLDALTLSVWFMDDGSKCGKRNYYLNTQQFRLRDQEKLREKLRGLGLESNLNKDKNYWRLRFTCFSLPLLRELMADNIIPSMRYKIGL